MPLRAWALRVHALGYPGAKGGPGGEKPVLQTSLEYQVKYNSSYLEIVFARKMFTHKEMIAAGPD